MKYNIRMSEIFGHLQKVSIFFFLVVSIMKILFGIHLVLKVLLHSEGFTSSEFVIAAFSTLALILIIGSYFLFERLEGVYLERFVKEAVRQDNQLTV